MPAGKDPDRIAVSSDGTNPIALVYRGPASSPKCSAAAAELLKSDTTQNFEVIYVGPNEDTSVKAGLKKPGVVLYVQPGGNKGLMKAYNQVKKDAPAIRTFVYNGGRYLGLCMGEYMVDNDPGYALGLNTNQYIITPDAEVTTEADSVIPVYWGGITCYMYFQDGPYFMPTDDDVQVLARYTNGEIAAMVQPYGKGKIGVSGTHPEATDEWYKKYLLTDPDGLDADQGHELIDTLMQ